MTGRRLYDLICDGVAKQGSYGRENRMDSFLNPMKAWTDLSAYEKSVFTFTANRLKGVKR